MSRIVAGEWRGRRLMVPRRGVRPTSERVREAVFNSLTARLGDWTGLRVLDLYAGSGALGLEALSRGASESVFVERDAGAAGIIRRNLDTLGAGDRAWVLARDVLSAARDAHVPFDVVFADPPYQDAGSLPGVLATYCDTGWFAPGAELVVETGRRAESPWGSPAHPGLVGVDRRQYGDTTVWYGRCDGSGVDPRSSPTDE